MLDGSPVRDENLDTVVTHNTMRFTRSVHLLAFLLPR
jgi:hypothetical protein